MPKIKKPLLVIAGTDNKLVKNFSRWLEHMTPTHLKLWWLSCYWFNKTNLNAVLGQTRMCQEGQNTRS
jgi:hypothetical protein